MGNTVVDQQRLWAPWRYDYVAGKVPDDLPVDRLEPSGWHPGAKHTCFLCRAAAHYADPKKSDRQNLVVWRGNHVFVILNRFPYNNGHILLAPYRHIAALDELTSHEHLETLNKLGELTNLMQECIQAEGFNIGLNLGRVAGAGVPGHLHWHLVPRWQGDHNFMPVTGSTSIIPQAIDSLWELLTARLTQDVDNS